MDPLEKFYKICKSEGATKCVDALKEVPNISGRYERRDGLGAVKGGEISAFCIFRGLCCSQRYGAVLSTPHGDTFHRRTGVAGDLGRTRRHTGLWASLYAAWELVYAAYT